LALPYGFRIPLIAPVSWAAALPRRLGKLCHRPPGTGCGWQSVFRIPRWSRSEALSDPARLLAPCLSCSPRAGQDLLALLGVLARLPGVEAHDISIPVITTQINTSQVFTAYSVALPFWTRKIPHVIITGAYQRRTVKKQP
jgi:hypothetical protein